jgi:gliding motility-associated-like protein
MRIAIPIRFTGLFFTVILGLLNVPAGYAQSEVTFRKFIYTPRDVTVQNFVKSGNKKFILAGGSEEAYSGPPFYLMQLDSCYNLKRTQRIYCKGPSDIWFSSPVHDNIIALSNGDLIAGFNKYDYSGQQIGGGLMRIDTSGKIIWSKIYCHNIAHFKLHPNGSIYFVGDVIEYWVNKTDTVMCLGQVSLDGSLVKAVKINTALSTAMDILDDGTVLATSRVQWYYTTDNRYRRSGNSIIMGFNSSLQLLWSTELKSKNSYLAQPWQIYGTPDKGILLGVNWQYDSVRQPNMPWRYYGLIKLDSSRKVKAFELSGHVSVQSWTLMYAISVKANPQRDRFYVGLWGQDTGRSVYTYVTDQNGSLISTIAEYVPLLSAGVKVYPFGNNNFWLEPTGELMFFRYLAYAQNGKNRSEFIQTGKKGFGICGGKEVKDSWVPAKIEANDISLQTSNYFFQQDVSMISEEETGAEIISGCENFILDRKIPHDTAVCFGSTLKLDAGYPAAKRIWSTGDTSQVIEITKNGTYWVSSIKECYHSEDTVNVKFIEPTFVELGPDRIICPGDSTRFEAIGTVPGLTYQWTLPKKDASGNPVIRKGNVLLAKDSGMYTVKVADAGGCIDLDTVHVIFHPMPWPDAGPDTTICYGSVIQMKGKGGITYVWTPAEYLDNARIASPKASPPKTQKYVLTISDTNGCIARDTVWLNVKPPLKLTFAEKEAKACQGGSVTFTAQAAGGQPGKYKIEWQKQGDAVWVSGSKTSWKADSSYVVFVRLTDGCSRRYLDSVLVNAMDTPKIIASVTPISGCEPLLVRCHTTGDTSMSFRWDMGDGHTYSAAEPFHMYLQAGKYKPRVTVTNGTTGCISRIVLTEEIEVRENAKAIMEIAPISTDLFHPEIIFTNRSKNAVSGRWIMNGISLSTNPVYTHTFTDTGFFTMQLVAFHKNGCTDTAEGKVYIREPFVVCVPNSFTPNRDGVNDLFKPLLKGVQTAPMQIYNRWGERVFEADALKGWDGSFKGRPCPPDIYLYMIQVKGKEGEKKYCSGTVTLLR